MPGAVVPGPWCLGPRVRAAARLRLRFLLRCPGCAVERGVLRNEIRGLPAVVGRGVAPSSGCVGSGRIRATTPRTTTVTRPG